GARPYTSPIFGWQTAARNAVRLPEDGLRRVGRLAHLRMIAVAPMSRPTAIEDLALSLPPKARLVGIDLGSKTIGLAISDVERRLASPLRTLPRSPFGMNAETLTASFSEHDVAGIVLGLPLDLD